MVGWRSWHTYRDTNFFQRWSCCCGYGKLPDGGMHTASCGCQAQGRTIVEQVHSSRTVHKKLSQIPPQRQEADSFLYSHTRPPASPRRGIIRCKRFVTSVSNPPRANLRIYSVVETFCFVTGNAAHWNELESKEGRRGTSRLRWKRSRKCTWGRCPNIGVQDIRMQRTPRHPDPCNIFVIGS